MTGARLHERKKVLKQEILWTWGMSWVELDNDYQFSHHHARILSKTCALPACDQWTSFTHLLRPIWKSLSPWECSTISCAPTIFHKIVCILSLIRGVGMRLLKERRSQNSLCELVDYTRINATLPFWQKPIVRSGWYHVSNGTVKAMWNARNCAHIFALPTGCSVFLVHMI